MISAGRECCELPPSAAPVQSAADGICTCEFVEYFGASQSRVSYHLGKLKAAGLIREERRGKWSFYSLDTNVAKRRLSEVGGYLRPHGPPHGSPEGEPEDHP